MSTNYARHCETKLVIFFGEHGSPLEDRELNQWAFWRVPKQYPYGKFHGRLIGETPEERAKRLGIEKT